MLKKNKYLYLLGAFAVVFAAYFQVMDLGFVWDDRYYLIDPWYLRDGAWYRIWHEPFIISDNYYRPFVLSTFLVGYFFHGSVALYYHVENLLIHCANVTLLIILSSVVFKDIEKRWGLAFFVGVTYGLHPVLLESVAWISGRFDLLVTFFGLSVLLVDQILLGWRKFVAVFFLFLCGALSKEMMVIVALLLPISHVFWRGENSGVKAVFLKENIYSYASVVLSGVLYLAIRYKALGYLYVSDSPMKMGTGYEHILLIAKSIFWYVKLSFYPFLFVSPQHFSATPVLSSDVDAWFGILLVALYLVILVVGRKNRVATGLGLAVFCSLLPIINIIPLTIGENIVSDRFLQFPLCFLVMVVCYEIWILALASKGMVKKITLPLVAAVWFSLSVMNIEVTLPSWGNNVSLWEWALQRNKNSAAVYGSLSQAYQDVKSYDLALMYALRAVELRSDWWSTWNTAGLVYGSLGDYTKSIIYLKVAEGLSINNKAVLNNMGYELLRSGNNVEAKEALVRSLRSVAHEPYGVLQENYRSCIYLTVAAYRMGNVIEAKKYFLQALSYAEGKRKEKMLADLKLKFGVDLNL